MVGQKAVFGWGKYSCNVLGEVGEKRHSEVGFGELLRKHQYWVFFKMLYVPLRMLCLLYITSDLGC